MAHRSGTGSLRSRSARTIGAQALSIAAIAALALFISTPAALGGSSGATMSGQFADSCTDFSAHSSKDVSHVVIHYADGSVVKDETMTGHDYAIDGDAAIYSIDVKSGTTTETFTCSRQIGPPTAVLEIQTAPVTQDPVPGSCRDAGDLFCEVNDPRTAWTNFTTGTVWWSDDDGCGPLPCTFVLSFRGTSSTDPDNDIDSWSIDFGDGTSVSGDWTTDPPTAIAHGYEVGDPGPAPVVSLSVTDAAGHSDAETISLGFVINEPF